MITDEQLDERADELTTLFDMAGYVTFTTNPLRIYWNLTREALGRDRVAEDLISQWLDRFELNEDHPLRMESESHLTTLRKRLGLTT